MHRLSARELRRSRSHMTAIRAAWVAVGAVAGISLLDPIGALDYQRPALWSGGYIAEGLALALLASSLLAWLAPRATLGGVVVYATVALVTGPDQPLWWWVAGVSAGSLLAFVLVRDSRARPRGEVVVPATGVPFHQSWAAPTPARRGLAIAGLAAIAAAGIAGLVFHQTEVAAVSTFESAAALQRVPVSAVHEDEEGYTFLTVVVDGVEHEIESPWYEEVVVGDPVDILSDGTAVVLAGAGQDNPAWILGLVAALPLLAAGVWGRFVAPGRRRERLVTHGAAGATVRVVCTGELALLLPTDANWPVLELTRLAGLVERQRVKESLDTLDENAWEPEVVSESADDRPLPVTAADVAGWADGVHAALDVGDEQTLTTDEKALLEAAVGPDTDGAEPFILVGGWAHGSTVALARTTGQVWLAEIEESQPFKGVRRVLKAVPPGRQGWDEQAAGTPSVLESLAGWAVTNGRWTRWVAALTVAVFGSVVVPWLVTESWGDWFDTLRTILLALAVVAGPFWATFWSTWQFARFREGFGWYGLLFDDVVGPARVELLAPGLSAVGVRMKDPEDLMSVDPAAVRAEATPEEAAVELRSWLDGAPPGSRGGRRPTPALVATVLMLVAWAVQFVG